MPRKGDICARYGGEEFSVLLPDTNLEGAKIVAERIRHSIEENPFILHTLKIPMTASIGGTAYLVGRYSRNLADELVKQADVALYKAKDQGVINPC